MKECYGKPVSFTAMGDDDPVQSGYPVIIRPGSHQVAQVDHERVRDYRYILPVTFRRLDLQAWYTIVVENGQAAPVGMLTASKLTWFGPVSYTHLTLPTTPYV